MTESGHALASYASIANDNIVDAVLAHRVKGPGLGEGLSFDEI